MFGKFVVYTSYETDVSGARYTNRLNDQHDHLEKENEEKDHEVETRITAECFVGGTVPE